MYAGGNFTTIGGRIRNYIAKLSTTGTGSADATWNPNANGAVDVIALSGTDLYVGGDFTTIGGQSRNRIAKLSTTSTGLVDATWDPNANSNVNTLALSGTHLYIGGYFTTIGGVKRSRLARIQKSNMELDLTWNPNANSSVVALALSGTDLYVVGLFTTIGGQSRNSIAKLSTTGTGLADATWNPNANANANSLALSGTDLYVGGFFTTIGGQSRNSIAKLSTTGTGAADATWNPNPDNYVLTLALSGADLYVGGSFTTIGGQSRNRIAKLSTTGTGTADATWGPNANSNVNTLALSGTSLYAGGSFTTIGGQSRNRIAKLSTTGTGTVDATWDPNANDNVNALALSSTDLYVGGDFTTIGGQSRNGIAKLSTTGTGTADATWDPNANNNVNALALSSTDLYVGGIFTTMDGISLPFFAVFTPTITLSTAALSGFSATNATASTTQTFNVSGIGLIANVSINVNTTDWELSTDNSTFFATLNLAQNSGTLTGQPIIVYVRLKAGLTAGAKTATLTASSTGVTDQIISLSGNVSSFIQYRTTGNVTFSSTSGWESSLDGATWSVATSAPNGSVNTLAINIRSGHTATISTNISLDELTVASGGTLQVNTGVTLTILDGTGTDISISGTLDIQGTGTLTGAGSLILNAGGTFTTSHIAGFNAIGITGTKTFSTGANYIFNGTSSQTINNPTSISANNFTLNNASGATLSNHIVVSNTLSILSGDLNLNGKNIDLGTTGNLSEDRANNHLVLDNTATNDANQGGSIIVSNATITNATTEIRGTGLYLRRTAGANYTVSFTRKHYRGSGNGIKRIYVVTGTPTGTNSIMRIYYANDELAGVSGMLRLFRWTAGTGWKKATDAGAGFTNGTNGADYIEATAINAFSTWTIGSETTPLPLTLLSFSGKRQDKDNILLNWKTANEVNTKGFEVEMSENGIDFSKMADVDKNPILSYELTLKNPNALYFRLKQVDLDGKFSYSNIVFVGGFLQEIKMFPNPISEYLTLENIPQNTKIVVNDLLGRIILETNSQKENTLIINVMNWQRGIYLVRVGKEVRKLIVE